MNHSSRVKTACKNFGEQLFQPRTVVFIWTAVVGWLGLNYAMNRVFQVDEFQFTQNAALMAKGGKWLAYAPIRQFYLILLSYVINPHWDSVTTLTCLRAIFFALLMINLLLLVQVQPFFKGKWSKIFVLLGATFLFPLWEHGIDIRSDNPVLFFELCGAGCVFSLMKTKGWKHHITFLLLGFSCAGMHHATAKGFAIWPPHVCIALGVCWMVSDHRRWRNLALAVAGIAVGFAAGTMGVWLINASLGIADVRYVNGNIATGMVRQALTVFRFSPWPLLKDEILKNPALVIAACAGILGTVRLLLARGIKECLPELACVGYVMWSIAFLRVNPTPYPYNMLHVAPFFFLLALAGAKWMWKTNRGLLSVLIVIHIMSFVREAQVSPFFLKNNFQQTSYIDAAELLTPEDEPVLDGVGMVTSRPPAGKDWWLHSFYMKAYYAGKRTNYAEVIREKLPPVVITNYRWRWLKGEEEDLLEQMYVEPHPDFHVLGADISPETKQINMARTGYYAVRSSLAEGESLVIDGRQCENWDIIKLEKGIHQVQSNQQASLLWVLKNSEQFPALLISKSARLFLKP